MFTAGTALTLPSGEILLRSAPERFLAWGLIFLAVMPISFVLWRRRFGGNIAPGAFFVSFFIPLIVLPGIAMESVRLTNDALVVKTGYWFAPGIESFPLRGLDRIEEERIGLRERRLFWSFRYGGDSRRLNLPDLLESNRPPIVDQLRRRGVQVIPESNSNKQ